MTQGDHGSGLVVAVGSVRQIIGRTVTDYPLHGVPLPLTAGTVLRDRNGGLWIGTTAHGIVYSHEGKTSAFTHNDGPFLLCYTNGYRANDDERDSVTMVVIDKTNEKFFLSKK